MRRRIFLILCAAVCLSLQTAAGAMRVKNLLVNGDAEGEFGEVTCALGKINAGDILPAEIEEEDGNHVFVVHAGAKVEHDWDNQFWIQAPEPFAVGDKVWISFRYRATSEAKASTEFHSTPGTYLDWNCLGNIQFATEWKTFESEITIRHEGTQAITFTLNTNYELPNDYFFDDLVLATEYSEKPDEPENPDDNMLTNGDAEGEYGDLACAWSKEDSGETHPAYIENRAGNNIFIVRAGERNSEVWDNQFWIMAPRAFKTGERFTVSFAYKAAMDARSTTQAHSSAGSYLHWQAIGDVNFTTQWQTFCKTVTVKSEMDGMRSIAFNLSEITEANVYYFDNLAWWEGEHEVPTTPLPKEFTDEFSPGDGKVSVVINEIMQSNIDGIMDDQNEFPDSWVELYNAGEEPVNLQNYRLGETDDPSQAWKLAYKLLAPGEFYLVYCDKAGSGRHTNFRLETGKGCTLFLFDKNKQVCDSLPGEMKKQPAPNIAFGRRTDGGDEWGYQLWPTPGEANCGEVVDRKMTLEDPLFSTVGRVFRPGETLSLSLTMPEGMPDSVQIRYTVDGSEPTEESALYEQPIAVDGTTILRAKPFCQGWLSPRSTTHSYIQMDRDVTLPVISLATDDRFLYDDEIGNYVHGTGSGTPHYERGWRRPMNFEFFEKENLEESVLNQLCEARVSGAWSRGFPLKTLAVYAHKRFGTKHFKYEFFPEQKPGLADFKSILLRNAGNDFEFIYMRDAVIHRLLGSHVSVDYQAWQPAIIFINGQYKGILNIRERSNEDNVYSNYDGLEDIDMIENWWEVKTGTRTRWDDFTNFYGQQGHSYEEFEERLDVQEFMDVMIINLLHCNLDFPGNNFIMWRPQADGGRWRAQMKDSDYSFGLYEAHTPDYNTLEWLYTPGYDPDHNWGNSSGATRLFRRLMDNERFRNEFIDRFAAYMGDFLGYEGTMEILEPMVERIVTEYRFHRELYGQSWESFGYEVDRAKSWLKKRIPLMYEQLANFCHLGEAKPLTIAAAVPQSSEERPAPTSAEEENSVLDDFAAESSTLSFNGFSLTRPVFDGRFFSDRDLLLSGEDIVGWTVTETYADNMRTDSIGGNLLDYSIPIDADSVSITFHLKPADIIDALPGILATNPSENQSGTTSSTGIYSPSGLRRPTLSRGVNIIRRADGRVTKKVVK